MPRTWVRHAIVLGSMSLGVGLIAVALLPVAPVLADNPLEAASYAAETLTFSGRLDVQWTDDDGSHQTSVDVQSVAGELQIGGPSVFVATLRRRYVVGPNGWDLLSGGDPSALGPIPPLTEKYHLMEGPGPVLLNRPTIEVDLGDAQRPAERLYLDRQTNLMLREDTYDANGEPVRSVFFEALVIGKASTPAKPAHTVDDLGREIGANSLPAPYLAPTELADGYQRVGVLEDSNGIQVVYSDGLHGLSVFEHIGALGPGSLPAGGAPVTIGRSTGVRYVWAGGQLVVWRERGTTYTAVGDAPAAEVLAAVDHLPLARGGSPWQRLRHACRRLVQAVSGSW
jgi:hypothetical protein